MYMDTKLIVYVFSFISLVACKTNETRKIVNDNVKKPNVIVILLDDAGYADFGFMGSEDLETPHIDKLASNGVVFSDAHVSSTVCAPSRAGLLSGTYQQRFGFEANHTGDEESGDIGLGDNVTTIATVFQKNDYSTIALGKWHLGAIEHNQPNQRGFDEFYGFLDGARSYFPQENPNEVRMLQKNGKRVIFEGYLTDVLTDRALGFVEENKSNSFFMYLAYNAVHTPMQAKEEHLEKYKDHPRKVLAAMTWSVDENIGRLTSKLENLGLLENTIIYFLSDNGGPYSNGSSNGALKGTKGNQFEGGHRVPFVMHYPSQLKGNAKFDGLTSSLDIFPTSMAAAGIQLPDSLKLDGVNLMPFVKGEEKGDPHDKLFWRKLSNAAARIGDYKMVRLDGYGSVLYNLNDDLGEQNNLSVLEGEILEDLKIELETWEKDMIPPLWQESEEWQEVIFNIHKQLMENKPMLYRNPRELRAYKKKNKS